MDQENEYLCKKCEVNLIDKTESEHSILCTTCRKEQIAYPVPKILLGVISLVLGIVIVLCITTLPKSMDEYRVYLDKYDSLLACNYNVLYNEEELALDNSQAIKILEVAMERGQYSYAIDVFNTYLAGKSASDAEINLVNQYLDKLDAYSYVWEEYYKVYDNIDQNLSYEEISKLLIVELNKLLEDSKYDKATIYYLLASMTDDNEKAKEYLNKSLEDDPNYLDSKIQMGNIQRRDGDFSSAEDTFNKVLENYETNSGALRGLAVLKLLEGNNKEAVELAKAAYDNDISEFYIYETLIIALSENGQAEEAKKYIDEYKEYGQELEEDTINLLAGSITLEDYYLN